jgi:hypothetical protein
MFRKSPAAARGKFFFKLKMKMNACKAGSDARGQKKIILSQSRFAFSAG